MAWHAQFWRRNEADPEVRPESLMPHPGHVAAFDEVNLAPFCESMTRTLRIMTEATELPASLVGASAFGVAWRDPAPRHAMEVERLHDRLRRTFPDRADAAIEEARHRAHTSLATYAQAVESVVADPGSVPAGAAYPQVASKDPQVGWFRRWLDRLGWTGRTP